MDVDGGEMEGKRSGYGWKEWGSGRYDVKD